MNNTPLEPQRARKCRPVHRRSLIKNWPVHNLLAHPLSEVVWWVVLPFSRRKAEMWCNAVHDCTVPEHDPGTGRG